MKKEIFAIPLALLIATSAAQGGDVITSTAKLSSGKRCSTWALKGSKLDHGGIILNFNEDLDVCFRKSGEIHRFTTPRVGISSDVDSNFTLAFAADNGNGYCADKIDEQNYSEIYIAQEGKGYEKTIITKGRGIQHRGVSRVCLKMFVENPG